MSTKIEHVILIGDHKQLRPKVNVWDLQTDSGMGYDMDRSLFERLVDDRSSPTCMLQTQYRMRPEISDLIRRTIYPHLQDGLSTMSYPAVRGMWKNLWFWDHRVAEDGYASSSKDFLSTGTDKSKSNKHEIDCVLALVNYLLQQGYRPEQITVLTGYSGMPLLPALSSRHACRGVRLEPHPTVEQLPRCALGTRLEAILPRPERGTPFAIKYHWAARCLLELCDMRDADTGFLPCQGKAQS